MPEENPTAIVYCPHCGVDYEVEITDLGAKASCEACGNTFILQRRRQDSIKLKAKPRSDSAWTERVEKSSKTPNLKACPDCGNQVSPSAGKCPHCGKKLQAGGCAKLFLFAGGCLLMLILIGTCMGNDPAYKNRPDPQAGWAVKNSSWDASVSQVERYLKRTLKNPSSYDGVEWSPVQKTPNGYVVRHKYRATNSFGAVVTEEKLFYLDKSGTVTHTMP